MTTEERVNIKRKAMRYDTITTWFYCGLIFAVVMLVTGWVDALR
jgi:hypothetical protein